MNPGDSYVLTFTNLPFVRTAIPGDNSALTLYFVNNGLVQGESLSVQCFDGPTNGIPYFGATLGGMQDNEFISGFRAWNLWPNLRSTVVITMLQGSVELQSIKADHVNPTTLPGLLYSQTFNVPEPTALTIAYLALFLVVRQRARFPTTTAGSGRILRSSCE